MVERNRLIAAGGRFRLPIWRNRWLCIWGVSLYSTFAALLLTPPSQFAAVFHIASIDFNSPGTANPVWQAYQDAGGQPSAVSKNAPFFLNFSYVCPEPVLAK